MDRQNQTLVSERECCHEKSHPYNVLLSAIYVDVAVVMGRSSVGAAVLDVRTMVQMNQIIVREMKF